MEDYPDTDDCRAGLRLLGTEQTLNFNSLHDFVASAVWWKHPTSGWVRAPKFADRLTSGKYGWEIKFGANRFLVSLALMLCLKSVSEFLDKLEECDDPSYPSLLNTLRYFVAYSVGNHKGEVFPGRYPVSDGMLVFGVHAIRVEDCVEFITRSARLSQYY